MTKSRFRSLALAALAAPLALSLAACGKDGGTAAPSGEKIAVVPPPAGKTWTDVVTRTPEGGYLMGNPAAPIKLLEFGALSCSHCADFAKASSAELRDKFVASGRVSYELRLFMLNALDMPAAMLATCGATEAVPSLAEQFWAEQGAIFANLQKASESQMQAIAQQRPPASFNALAEVAGMKPFFAARGIAADQANACLADTAKATELAKQTQDASTKYEITGTPTFMINGEKVDLSAWPEIKARLETMGAR